MSTLNPPSTDKNDTKFSKFVKNRNSQKTQYTQLQPFLVKFKLEFQNSGYLFNPDAVQFNYEVDKVNNKHCTKTIQNVPLLPLRFWKINTFRHLNNKYCLLY